MTTFEERLKDTLSHTYDIERELGGGGMSRVFVAIDRSLRRKVVIKLLSPELIADVNRDRFRREIQVAAQLQHPHIVTLLSAGEHEDLVWYTMPFIAGESLRSAVEKNGPMSVTDVVRVLYHVTEALDYAHGEGVVHRDIKSANILLSGTYALVTDFGVAKALNASMPASAMTQTGMAIGTPAYMAPEQLAGDPAADHRIDIYAVGLLAYELLNGRSPYAATSPQKILLAVLSQDPQPLIEVRPDVPRSLSELVMSCLAKEPDERPASARKLLNALDTFSTASGEIRTMEHRIPRIERTVPTPVPDTAVPTAVPATPPRDDSVSIAEPTPSSQIETVEQARPQGKGNQKKLLLGGLALLLVVAAGAILLARRAGNGSSNASSNVVAPPAKAAALVAESAVSIVPPPAAVPESVVAAPKPVAATIDSQAIKDSLKRARTEAAKVAAAKRDSLRKAESARGAQTNKTKALSAVEGFLSNASARKAFDEGTTRKGGLLGSKRVGNLQVQINALLPWLTQAGLTYEQFKAIVAESGVKMFDEFGRITLEALQQFVGSGH
jgi:serine/threonine protein kinase